MPNNLLVFLSRTATIWRTVVLCCLWPVASVAADLPLRPGVGPQDQRVVADVRHAPWNSLVRVQTELGVRCSGFLIAPRIVMTAAHCLYLSRVRRFIQPQSVHVLLAYSSGSYVAHARVASFTVPPAYNPLDEGATAGADRAVLVLQQAVAGDRDVLPIAPAPALPNAPIMLGGYGQDRDEIVLADPACALMARATDGQGRPLLVHDCDATRGTSGGPMLWRRPDGRWAAIGIQIEAAAGRGGRAVPLVPANPATVADTPAGR